MMCLRKAFTKRRLSGLWNIKELETEDRSIVVFSDLHLGDGGDADNFKHNRSILEEALKNYEEKGFTVILLGDIEEFWQFEPGRIFQTYRAIYEIMDSFKDGFLYRVWGNHDSEWGVNGHPVRKHHRGSEISFSAMTLKDKEGISRILLIHGFQGDLYSDVFPSVSRWVVNLHGKTTERLEKWFSTHYPAKTKTRIPSKYERTFYTWAKKSGVVLICGHSHRAIFASKSYFERLEEKEVLLKSQIASIKGNDKLLEEKREELKKVRAEKEDEEKKRRRIEPVEPFGEPLPCYFNTGCGQYPSGITAIEIEDDKIRLVEWSDKEEHGIIGEPFKDCEMSLSECIKEVVDGRDVCP
jgi:UDP-2,3-diacylglucosamine pyrophosphatase LpxH